MDYNAFTASEDSGFKRLYGFFIAEVAGTPAAARVNIRDGGATGAIVVPVELAANGSVGQIGLNLPARSGTFTWYVEVAAGTVAGSIIGG